MKFLRILFYFIVIVIDYIMLDLYWSYDLNIDNMSYIVLGFVLISTAIVYLYNHYLKIQSIKVFLIHNVIFLSALFLFAIHSFLDPWPTSGKIILPLLFLIQSGILYLWYQYIYKPSGE